MIRLAVVLVAFVIAAVSVADVTGDYVAQQGGSLVNLNLNAQGKSVAGYMLICNQNIHASDGTSIEKFNVSGSITDSNLRISTLSGTPWTGTVKGTTIRMKWPLDNGQVQEVTFTKITAKTWNSKLTEYKSRNRWIQYQHNFASAIKGRIEYLEREIRGATSDVKDAEKDLDKYSKELEDQESLKKTRVAAVTEKEKKVLGVQAKVDQQTETNKTANTPENRALLSEYRSQLQDAKSELRDAQSGVRDVDQELAYADRQLKEARLLIGKLGPETAGHHTELQLLSMNSVRAYFSSGASLPVKQIKGVVDMFESPQRGAKQVWTSRATDVTVCLPTTGSWYVVLLQNRSLAWVKKLAAVAAMGITPSAVKKHKSPLVE